MKLWKACILCCLVVALAIGCSDKQEEAEKLEQEMLEREGTVDTGTPAAETALPEDDTMPTADVTAVPEEDVEPVMEDLPMAPASGGYTLQVASCPDADYARHLVTLYRDRGYTPYVMTATVEGVDYYRVRIGDLASKAEADALKAELRDRFSIDPWLTQHGMN
ncbi:hypothetical protein GF377_01265 [candidate division GN15 bacterium]|nr:hypothetical protein [candidate division GN15 bacterium]